MREEERTDDVLSGGSTPSAGIENAAPGQVEESLAAQPDAVFAELEREARRRMRAFRIAVALVVAFAAATALALLLSGGHVRAFTPAVFIVLVVAAQRLRRSVSALAEHGGVRAIPSLLEALSHHGRRVARIAESKLIELLPLVRASDAPLFQARDHAALCSALLGKRNPALALAILQALSQVGDGTEEKAVSTVAVGQSHYRRGSPVSNAAWEVLPALHLKAEAAKSERLLLRPAEQPEPASTLLRPAQVTGSSDPDELLRPADPVENRAADSAS